MTGDGLGEAGRPLRQTPLRFGLLAGIGALLAYTGFLTLRHLGTVLSMLLAALFFTLGLERPVRALMRRGLSRGIAVAVLIAGLSIVLCGFLALVVPNLAKQTAAFFEAIPGYADRLPDSQVWSGVADLVTPANVAKLATGLIGSAASVVGAVFLGLTTIMLTLFLLAGFDRVSAGAYRFVEASRRERVRGLGNAMLGKVGAYLTGAVMIALCAATATLVWCLLTGIPYPLMLAVVVGVLDMIPQIGATLGSTVAILMALTVSLPLAILTLLFFLVYQGVENWIVYPRMMSRAVKISNLAAIVSALIGGALFGILGVLIAVPAYASIQLFVREVVFPRQDAR